jgi:hypothetical protein
MSIFRIQFSVGRQLSILVSSFPSASEIDKKKKLYSNRRHRGRGLSEKYYVPMSHIVTFSKRVKIHIY